VLFRSSARRRCSRSARPRSPRSPAAVASAMSSSTRSPTGWKESSPVPSGWPCSPSSSTRCSRSFCAWRPRQGCGGCRAPTPREAGRSDDSEDVIRRHDRGTSDPLHPQKITIEQKDTMKKHLISGSLAVATAMVVTGCTPPGGGDGQSGGNGSVLNIGWNEAFRSMNDMTMDGNAVANTIVAYMTNDNFKYYDDELELHDGALGDVEKVSEDPLKVKYTFSDEASWSDGTPVDAVDLTLTWAARSQHFNTIEDNRDAEGTLKDNPEDTVYFDSSAVGAPLIKDFPEISEDRKSVTFTYSKPFADWETEFGLGAYGSGVPAHIVAKNALGTTDAQEGKEAVLDAIEDEDETALSKISNFWNTGFDFTSMPEDKDLLVHNGPYEITDFEEGQSLTVSRDEDYTGPIEPGVDTVTIRYIGDPMAMVQAIENGEVDLTQPQSTADVLAAAEQVEGVEILPGEDATFE